MTGFAHNAAAMLHAFRLGGRGVWTQKAALLSAFGFYCILVGLWASMWHLADPARLAQAHMTYAQAVWYGAAGELITFALAQFYRDIEDDIQGGQMTVHLLRPVGYAGLAGADRYGQALMRTFLLGIGAAIYAFVLTGTCPLTPLGAFALVILGAAGIFLWLVIQMMIGLGAGWLSSMRPVYMITQKVLFVLGGMIVPVSLFPAHWQVAAWTTPFPAVLYAAGSVVLDPSPGHVARMLALQGCWIAVMLVLLIAMLRAFERRLIVKGD